ncbi:MAG: response regulator [Bacteroidales bacterium]|nr:response regulator [Bacteroidales bacterium]
MNEVKSIEKPILEIIFFEDEQEIAENIFDHLKLPNVLPNYYDDDKQLDQVIINNKTRKVYFIDLNLGFKKKVLGIDIIKKIRNVDITSLIIVYSAYEDYKEQCYDLGANFFFLKETSTYEDDILIIRNIIMRELQHINIILGQ